MPQVVAGLNLNVLFLVNMCYEVLVYLHVAYDLFIFFFFIYPYCLAALGPWSIS